MRSLSSIILFFGWTISLFAQSPHGVDFKVNCAACHSSETWEIPADHWDFKEPEKPRVSKTTGWEFPQDTLTFNHYNTNFPLVGQHASVDCRACHETLIFQEAQTDCISCHTDMHQQTVGADCARCHTEENWLVDNITDLHIENGFPLLGVHAAATCTDCHLSSSDLQFDRIGNDCINCHLSDFNATTNPNHPDAGFSTDCTICHNVDATDWETEEVDHDFFPLTKGHDIADCAKCHTGGDYANTPTDCVACHQRDFNNSESPDHQTANFVTDCASCHTTDPDWTPAELTEHDANYFPIYSGSHEGEWTQCIDCHNNPANYADFTCINCHINPETDEEHTDVNGYVYENTACLACHPTGDSDESFDHDQTDFPLTGAHITTACVDCHTNGYVGTPTDCASCHTTDFDQSTNPNHNELNIPTDCASCHSTEPGWSPATFDIHDDYYALNGAHAVIHNDCVTCHNGDYNNTPNTCAGCHTEDFNQTIDPDHEAAQFPLDCETCHSEIAWVPSSFDHDALYPLTGAHQPIENECALCHINGNYDNTPNTCAGCHTSDYDQSTNPNHTVLNLPTDCESCHTTEPEWIPATFDIHDDYYVLNGAHAVIANDCAACHNGDYNNTPNTCFGCHEQDYTATVDPNHTVLQFSTDCATCHTEIEWVPATFDHDGEHFPIYSGTHEGEWSECIDCHTNPSNYLEFTCITCHTNPQTDDDHTGINGYTYDSPACLACHPTGDADDNFDHNLTAFPLTGAHITTDCIECHAGGFEGTPTDCAACHTPDFTQASNPNHMTLGLSTDCISCHTTEPGWSPASFDNHDDYYALNGAHAAISNDCATCHNGDYNNTPNTCAGCHTTEYIQTTNPDHQAAQFPLACESCHGETTWVPSSFDHDAIYPLTGAHQPIENDCALCHINGNYNNTPNTCEGCHTPDFNQSVNPSHTTLNLPMDCESCHTTEPDWSPATFDIHDDYYVLNGAHAAIANDCAACHNGDYNNTPSTCFGCHEQDYTATVDPNHTVLQFSTDCATCHTETEWVPATFDHDGQYFPIYSGAHDGEWSDCIDCHSNPSNYAEFTCITCHANPQTDNDHIGINGYTYDSPACLACHPTGDANDNFDHNLTNFLLTGAHITTDCIECHANGYVGTPMDCAACHTTDFNQSTNPSHNGIGLSTDCVSCHTTDPGWSPATFDIHNDYYALNGAHAAISNDCAACHNGDYNNTPNTCAGCHTPDYNQTTDPDHQAAQFPIDCQSCHTETAWAPSTFDHNSFYPLTGAHQAIENDCALCHSNGNYSNTPNTCAGCHTTDYNQTTDPDHQAAQFPMDCESCHTETAWVPSTFDHNGFYPLTGAHQPIENDCALCHINGNYNNTPNTCEGCHTPDYNQSVNPSHSTLNLPMDCESCHTTEPDWSPASFDIHDDYYVLNGAHAAIANDCATCHNGDYNNTPNTCFACHEQDYNNTTNPNHATAQFSTDCQSCHTEDQWVPATFDHDGQYFPIYSGTHNGEWNACVDCHTNPSNYEEFTCITCHTNPQTDNEHNGVGGYIYESSACLACHPTGEATGGFDHNQTNFPLTGAHINVDCISCHANGYVGTPTDCAACHLTDFNGTSNPDHGALGFPTDCESCHTTEPDWSPATMLNHDDYYVLNGAHAVIANDCVTCHNGDYNNTPNTCAGCHTPDYNQTTDPDHQAAQFPIDCESCHTETAWAPSTLDHNSFYPLTGAHALIENDCALCHVNGNYNNTPNTCAGCHTPDYNQTTDPDHQAAQFPMECETCHTETTWVPSTFDHNGFYLLTGAHQAIENDCALCHVNGNYNNTPNTCEGCHTPDYNQSVNPNHSTLNLPMDCESCHTTEPDWSPASFDIHDDYYVLNGAHAAIANDCATCHNGDYNNTPNTCFACHEQDYNNTTNPNHAAAQFSTDCQSCHTEDQWIPATFDHDGQYFPIYSGTHNGEWDACVDCHTNPSNYEEFTCITCHTNPQTDDDHNGVGGYVYESSACLACHPTGEATGGFDHNQTNFPLTGAHINVDCISCHANGYVGTPTDCAACHLTDFNGTSNPDHGALGFSTDCESCHTTEPDWEPATLANHDDYYVLNGAHAAIANDCAACHNGDYINTPNTCAGCHTTEYNQTTDPDHQAAQFPMECETCHTETAWVPSTFDHNAFYPLTGAHNAIANDCAICHNGDYVNTPNTCEGCHTPDYNQSVNPSHTTLNLPMDCESCHTTEPDWSPATFDIHDDYYVLNGAHAAIANDCAACHNGDYNNTPNTCFACHEQDYNNTTNPNHAAAQFSTDCQSCHTEDQWVPTTFDHDGLYFPIYSGTHDGEWDDCVDCHTNPSNFAEFTCITCHSNPETDDAHNGVGGYVYESTACLACHPTGEATGGFDHNQTNFPLTGAHIGVACIDCHANGYVGTPTDCAACHTTDYNQSTNPNHLALGFSTDCASCHSIEPDWEPATLDNHDDYYLLDGAHAVVANDCVVCHNGDYVNTPNTCDGCHLPDYNQSANPNHTALNIPTNCETCHTTEPGWSPATFEIHDDYYPLDGAHAVVANDCAVCHNGDYVNTPNACDGCHLPDYNQAVDPNHLALTLPTNCDMCHTTEPDWEPATFPIHDDYYMLNGAHAAIANDCALCHNGSYINTPTTCFGCHEQDYNQTTNPNHAAAQFPLECETCHSEDAWVPSTFDHNIIYPLTGAHAVIENDCALCHSGGYVNTPNTCDGCHMPDYNQSINPNHVALGFPTDCESCHTTEPDWSPATFDIHDDYYPLDGAHTAVANDCALCHNGDYVNTPNTCDGCHLPDYNQSVNPSHVALTLPMNCDMCHTTEPDWEPATFPIHDDYYMLNGAHAAIANDCALCHNGDYVNTPNTCFGCHEQDYNQTTNPNHAAAQFPTECETCHSEDAWVPSTFDHNNIYPLTGAHAIIENDCALCHSGGYVNTPNTCDGCHMPDYNQSINPNHAALGFPTDCESCHTTEPDWSPATFDIHDDYYVLDGAHVVVANDCALCHNGDYVNTPNTCDGCHLPDYNQAVDPNHVALSLPTNCDMCHTTEPDWEPATFPIHNDYYMLNGAHAAIANDCALCHNGSYINTPNTCFGCHEQDYNQTSNPNHAAAQFPTECETCHSEDAWVPSTFDHNNIYPLTGAHAIIENDCALCHSGGYVNTPNTCDGCHMPDYNQSINPNHVALAIPTDCESCHTTEPDWNPATFDIHDNYYVLNGAHAAISNDCAVCHNGDYVNTPNTCFGCHESDYNGTTNPNHSTAGFPTTCESCHSEDAWVPSTFDHDNLYFPIYSGKHDGEWNQCVDCHTTPGNFMAFSCIDCHEHDNQADVDDDHSGVSGYEYASPACYACHPNGEN